MITTILSTLTPATLGARTTGRAVSLATALALCGHISGSHAEDYYRWVNDDGVTHYGSTPPQGVEAVKVKAYGGQNTAAPSESDEAASETEDLSLDDENLPPEERERRRKLADKQRKICDDEKSRLSVLEKNGRIRMKEQDGSYRYMTQTEIQAEIATSKNIMKDVCTP
jgi:hypothetical protein